jgi:hypothetical protein
MSAARSDPQSVELAASEDANSRTIVHGGGGPLLEAGTRTEGTAEACGEADVGQMIPRLRELLVVAQETAHGMLEAEEALGDVRRRFEHTEDPAAQGELAVEALDHVERQLKLTRERRRQLDGVEGKLWARRNGLQRFLIHTRGAAWWHARRNPPQLEALGHRPGRAR